jgi:hypothetical protein
MQPVQVASKDLFHYGLLYVSGHGPLKLSRQEKERLRAYLARGGTILADPCCGRRGFDGAFRTLMTDLFGAGALQALPAEHEIFDVAYSIEQTRACAAHKQARYRETPPRLAGVTLDGRLAVIYSPVDLGCGWAHYKFGAPCQLHDDDALKLTVNAIVYALTQ